MSRVQAKICKQDRIQETHRRGPREGQIVQVRVVRQKVQPELFPDSSHAEVTPDDRASMQGLQKELYQKEQFDQTPQDDSSSRRLKPSNAELGNHSIFHCERATAQFFTHYVLIQPISAQSALLRIHFLAFISTRVEMCLLEGSD